MAKVDQFWNVKWQGFKAYKMIPEEYINRYRGDYYRESKVVFSELMYNVRNSSVLDLGCGNGELTAFLGMLGNNVTAVDTSETGIENTRQMILKNNIEDNARAYVSNIQDMIDLNQKYDFVVGTYILHHIEPFHEFVDSLDLILNKGGRAIFLENNSRNPFLMFARKFTGKFGIPKYGDAQEYPFQPKEIKMLKKKFKVEVTYPMFLCFGMISNYIFKNKYKTIGKFLSGIDKVIYKLSIFNHYSYSQIVTISK